MEISDILFKRIKVGKKTKIIFKNLSYRNLVNSIVKILQEILRVFMQISKILVQKC